MQTEDTTSAKKAVVNPAVDTIFRVLDEHCQGKVAFDYLLDVDRRDGRQVQPERVSDASDQTCSSATSNSSREMQNTN
jgi:hypothetical protein